jgi:DNA-binding NtrC family response regulator
LERGVDHAVKERIRAVLEEVGGVRVEAARRLAIDRTTLYRLIRKLEIDDESQA